MAHGEHRIHAQRFKCGLVQNLDLQTVRFERAEPFHKLWRRQDVRWLIHQVARKVDAFEESFVFLKSARELLPGMRKDRQTRRAAIILRFGFFGVERVGLDWPRVLGFVLLAAGAALMLKR